MADIEPHEAMGQGGAVLVGGGEGARDDETATSVSRDETMKAVVGHESCRTAGVGPAGQPELSPAQTTSALV
jgi:hypothetical protein